MSSICFGLAAMLLAMSSVYLGRSATRPKPHEIKKRRTTGLLMLSAGTVFAFVGGVLYIPAGR